MVILGTTIHISSKGTQMPFFLEGKGSEASRSQCTRGKRTGITCRSVRFLLARDSFFFCSEIHQTERQEPQKKQLDLGQLMSKQAVHENITDDFVAAFLQAGMPISIWKTCAEW